MFGNMFLFKKWACCFEHIIVLNNGWCPVVGLILCVRPETDASTGEGNDGGLVCDILGHFAQGG